ncbi:MAG TPA: TonB-dependent receptor, partial [Bacteroidales bacterium]|nr:TonB-dependent receptor [Bacteroidales bacterium]
IRGPASLLYGSNAMGGVINVITKKNEREGFSGDAYAAYGSFNTLRAGASAGFSKNGFSSGISVNHSQTNGHRDSSEFDIINLHAFAKYELDNWSSKFGFTIADYSFMDPGPESSETKTFLGDISRNMLTFSIRNNYEFTRGGLYAFYNAGTHDFSDGWYSEDANYGINLYQGIDTWRGGLVTAGVDMKNYGASGSFANIGPPNFSLTNYQDTTLTLNEMAAYILLDQQIGKFLSVSAGGRYDVHSLYGGEFIPQLAVTFKPSQSTTMKGLFSKGFRNPTLMDLYLFPVSNPELGPERLWNYEFSFGQRIGANGIINASAYLLDASNLITIEANDTPPPPGIKVNGGSFINWGLEFEGNYYLTDNIEIDASYSYLNTSQKILFAPEHQFYAGVRYAFEKLSFVLNAKSVNGLYTKIDNETVSNSVMESYTLLNSRISYNILEMMQLYFSGKNLLNIDYQTVYGYTMPGIHAMIGMNVSFN